MDGNRNSQGTGYSSPSKFVTQGSFRDVINTAGHVTMGNHVEHNTILDNNRINLYPDFVVPDAGYQGNSTRSGCLKATREAVIEKFLSWKDDIAAAPICLLSGPAGFGKSAIAQTVTESFAWDRTLIASFFFLRGAGGRSEFTHFITTLSFQITVAIPEAKPIIEKALWDDPSIPHQSIAHQLQKLVMAPLMFLFGTHSPTRPLVIVIDALDECNDKQAMKTFIGIIASASSAKGLPLRWFLTSRPEGHIDQAFSGDTARAAVTRVALEDFDATADIENLLKHHFALIHEQNPRLMRGVSLPWPSIKEIRALVKKADGMFVFAAILAGFITDEVAPPQRKLKSVLSLHSAGLDPLYAQVLGAVPYISCFRRVLTTLMIVHIQPSINVLVDLLQLEVDDVLYALNFILAIVYVPGNDNTPIRLHHTSLRDFLMDEMRSNSLFIDPPPAAHFTLFADCVKLMKRILRQDVFTKNAGALYAMEYWVRHLQDSSIPSEAFHELLCCLDDFLSSEIMEVWINQLILNEQISKRQLLIGELIIKYQSLQGGGNLSDILKKIDTRLATVCHRFPL